MSGLFDLDNLSKRLHILVTQQVSVKPEGARLLEG